MKTMDAYYLSATLERLSGDLGARIAGFWSLIHQELRCPTGSVSSEPFAPLQILARTLYPVECADAAHDAVNPKLVSVQSTIIGDAVKFIIKEAK